MGLNRGDGQIKGSKSETKKAKAPKKQGVLKNDHSHKIYIRFAASVCASRFVWPTGNVTDERPKNPLMTNENQHISGIVCIPIKSKQCLILANTCFNKTQDETQLNGNGVWHSHQPKHSLRIVHNRRDTNVVCVYICLSIGIMFVLVCLRAQVCFLRMATV